MKKQDLTDLGIAEDVAEKIFALHGKGLEPFKAQVTDLTKQLEAAGTQLTEANKQIEGFKGMNVDEIKKSADEYKAKFEQAQKDATDQLAALKFDHALEAALTGAKAKNPKAVTALLSRDALKLNEDGTILGLTEQLEKVKTENDYLFESDKPAPRVVAGANNKSVIGDPVVMAARKAAGLPLEIKE